MSSIDSANGYSQPAKMQYTPPTRQKDDDSARYQAEQKSLNDRSAVNITLSSEAQKALTAQKSGQQSG